MYERLKRYAASHQPIRVALVGAGSMGRGIAQQLRQTPGMELVCVCDQDELAALAACDIYGGQATKSAAAAEQVYVTEKLDFFDGCSFDVLVEATNSIAFAADACRLAIEHGQHVVLMNAEVDLALGVWLHELASHQGVVVTSDAGDPHGVLLRMLDEIKLWGFHPVMAGNIKGFLNRYATAQSLEHEAKIRRLNPIQCSAYTDGTRLNVEMALVANAAGMLPFEVGMEGPVAEDVLEVLQKFDFEKYDSSGVVDYILGARPRGGVFVVGHCEDEQQRPYLQYYKLGEGPYYLFYRPYHLCHLETPWAIASVVLDKMPVLAPAAGRLTDVYAYAKQDLGEGQRIDHAIGGDACYGMIDICDRADAAGHIPIAMLEATERDAPVVARNVPRDEPLGWDDVQLHDSPLLKRFRQHILPTL